MAGNGPSDKPPPGAEIHLHAEGPGSVACAQVGSYTRCERGDGTSRPMTEADREKLRVAERHAQAMREEMENRAEAMRSEMEARAAAMRAEAQARAEAMRLCYTGAPPSMADRCVAETMRRHNLR